MIDKSMKDKSCIFPHVYSNLVWTVNIVIEMVTMIVYSSPIKNKFVDKANETNAMGKASNTI